MQKNDFALKMTEMGGERSAPEKFRRAAWLQGENYLLSTENI